MTNSIIWKGNNIQILDKYKPRDKLDENSAKKQKTEDGELF